MYLFYVDLSGFNQNESYGHNGSGATLRYQNIVSKKQQNIQLRILMRENIKESCRKNVENGHNYVLNIKGLI